MGFLIRNGEKEDVKEVLSLIKELAEFENAIHEVSITEEELKQDGFGNNPSYWLTVAEKDSEIIGMALYFYRYSTWKGRVLYLEDFIVKKEYRQLGIGSLMFDELKKKCIDEGVKALVWQVLNWNESAIKFYNKHNAHFSKEWLNGKLEFQKHKLYKTSL